MKNIFLLVYGIVCFLFGIACFRYYSDFLHIAYYDYISYSVSLIAFIFWFFYIGKNIKSEYKNYKLKIILIEVIPFLTGVLVYFITKK
ncbi:MAG: hypothetical protein A2231_08980 [Candidatus Firestonebacteria bacterium RIFOXYA2_FULL_40_8]|nr:MAG: hypothetical protein A2231_08980 [Candidatus Firestonebacteria bacterium RIFOXYA2_FULL_40_8]